MPVVIDFATHNTHTHTHTHNGHHNADYKHNEQSNHIQTAAEKQLFGPANNTINNGNNELFGKNTLILSSFIVIDETNKDKK